MSDTAEWTKCGVCSVYKVIDGVKFTITPTGAEFLLSLTSLFGVAERPTLAECQRLAHETARLWAGERICL